MTDDLLARLCDFYAARPDRRGEVHVDCPWCGKEAKRGQTHFSFSTRGYFCFVCGEGGEGLERLADHVGLHTPDDWTPPPAPKPKPKRRYRWQDEIVSLVERWRTAPGVVEAWQRYRPLSTEAIRANRLGLGVLPSSRCKHRRLLIPLVDFDGAVVGVRGRSIDCDCGRWLSPAGNEKTLYNWQALGHGQIVFLVENAADALLLTERMDAVAVATLSISYWGDGWGECIAEAEPEKVVVAYDNHWPAMGTHPDHWLEEHERLPLPACKRRWNDLTRAGVESQRLELYDWGDEPVGTDIGDILVAG